MQRAVVMYESASTNYGTPAFPQSFASTLAAELDGSDDCAAGGISPNFDANGNDQLVGYVTIDMVNYCTFANPNDPTYWQDVRPILRKHCVVCHSERKLSEVDVSAGLALDR